MASSPSPSPPVDLASLLPSTIGGVKGTISSATGSAILDTVGNPDALTTLAATLGVAIDGVQFATGTYAPGTHVTGYRFPGVPEATLLSDWLASPEVQSGVTISEVTLSGKSVMKWTSGSQSAYLYAHDDVMFIVNSPSSQDSAEAVSKLP